MQAFTSNLFASYVVELEAEGPLKKPFKVCLPFKDGKKRDYCNVFAQRDDGPWTLAYNRFVVPCRMKITLEFNFLYFPNGKFAKFYFHLLSLYF